jgi:histidinol phosphatase-like PHP family hydrolase
MRFTTSDDSHGPDDVGLHYVEMYRVLDEMGISRLCVPK